MALPLQELGVNCRALALPLRLVGSVHKFHGVRELASPLPPFCLVTVTTVAGSSPAEAWPYHSGLCSVHKLHGVRELASPLPPFCLVTVTTLTGSSPAESWPCHSGLLAVSTSFMV